MSELGERARPSRHLGGRVVETSSYAVDPDRKESAGTLGSERQPGLSARSKAFSPIQNNSDLAQGPLRLLWGIIPGSPIKVTPAICGGRAEMEGAKQKD